MNKNFKIVLGIVVALVIFLAFMDTLGAKMFSTVGTGYAGEIYSKMESSYMVFFWVFAYALIVIAALMYYLWRKDKSESLALVITYLLLVKSGWEDIFYYLIKRIPFDATMPWLDKSWIMGPVSRVLGYAHVTPTSLFVSAGIGAIASYILVRYLERKKW